MAIPSILEGYSKSSQNSISSNVISQIFNYIGYILGILLLLSCTNNKNSNKIIEPTRISYDKKESGINTKELKDKNFKIYVKTEKEVAEISMMLTNTLEEVINEKDKEVRKRNLYYLKQLKDRLKVSLKRLKELKANIGLEKLYQYQTTIKKEKEKEEVGTVLKEEMKTTSIICLNKSAGAENILVPFEEYSKSSQNSIKNNVLSHNSNYTGYSILDKIKNMVNDIKEKMKTFRVQDKELLEKNHLAIQKNSKLLDKVEKVLTTEHAETMRYRIDMKKGFEQIAKQNKKISRHITWILIAHILLFVAGVVVALIGIFL